MLWERESSSWNLPGYLIPAATVTLPPEAWFVELARMSCVNELRDSFEYRLHACMAKVCGKMIPLIHFTACTSNLRERENTRLSALTETRIHITLLYLCHLRHLWETTFTRKEEQTPIGRIFIRF